MKEISYPQWFAVVTDVLPMPRIPVEVHQCWTVEEFGLLGSFQQGFWKWSKDMLHYTEMFKVAVSLEHCDSRQKLKHDTADAPQVARVWPVVLQDDFGCPVMPGRYRPSVVLKHMFGWCNVVQDNEAKLRWY